MKQAIIRKPFKEEPSFEDMITSRLRKSKATTGYRLGLKEVPTKYSFSRKERNIWKLVELYRQFVIEVKEVSQMYKVFTIQKDPRLDKRKWKCFLSLYEMMVNEGINPRTYFFYHFRVTKFTKSWVHYFIGSILSLTSFLEWKKKVKQMGQEVDKLAYLKHEEKKQRNGSFYEQRLKRKLKDYGYKKETVFFKNCALDEIAEFSKEWLMKRDSFKLVWNRGYFKGLNIWK